VKRLLAYSSIGHAGYLMMGVTAVVASGTPALRQEAPAAVLFYLFAYYVTTITAFAVVAAVSARRAGTRPRSPTRPVPALAVPRLRHAPRALSLAGCPSRGPGREVPPLLRAGGRRQGSPRLVALASVGALSVVLSLYFYLLLIREMYAKDALPKPPGLRLSGSPSGTRWRSRSASSR